MKQAAQVEQGSAPLVHLSLQSWIIRMNGEQWMQMSVPLLLRLFGDTEEGRCTVICIYRNVMRKKNCYSAAHVLMLKIQ